MRKSFALLMVLCVVLTISPVYAYENDYGPDNPYLYGIDYSKPYREYGAVPAQLNFGKLRTTDAQVGNTEAAKTITSMPAKTLEKELLEDEFIYYVYAKHQTSKSVPKHTIETMLVLQDPYGNYFTSYDMIEVDGTGNGRRYSGLGRFFDVSFGLLRCYFHHGELPKGEYILTMYYNNQFFRATSFTLR